MRTFCLTKYDRQQYPQWRELVKGDRLENEAGGYTLVEHAEAILETVEAEDWINLDYALCRVANAPADSMTGWCSPEGKFHPVFDKEHDMYAADILHMHTRDMELRGWARCFSRGEYYNARPDQAVYFITTRHLTAEQSNTLNRMGFVIEDEN